MYSITVASAHTHHVAEAGQTEDYFEAVERAAAIHDTRRANGATGGRVRVEGPGDRGVMWIIRDDGITVVV